MLYSVNSTFLNVLKYIADEERVHTGEFLRLLKELAPDEEKFYREGAKEVEEEINKQSRGNKKWNEYLVGRFY